MQKQLQQMQAMQRKMEVLQAEIEEKRSDNYCRRRSSHGDGQQKKK